MPLPVSSVAEEQSSEQQQLLAGSAYKRNGGSKNEKVSKHQQAPQGGGADCSTEVPGEEVEDVEGTDRHQISKQLGVFTAITRRMSSST